MFVHVAKNNKVELYKNNRSKVILEFACVVCLLVIKGNTFSSLEGLEFEWSLLSDNDADVVVDAKTILRYARML